MHSKNCVVCNAVKELSLFTKDVRNKDGCTGTCKVCKAEQDKIRGSLPGIVEARKVWAKTYRESEKGRATRKSYDSNEKNIATRKTLQSTPEAREKQKAYRKTDARKEVLKKHRNTEKGKASSYKARTKRVKMYPELKKTKEHMARLALNNAVRRGKVAKLPCWECGETGGVEGHHPDYDAPLDVIWLCRKHHKQLHDAYTQVCPVGAI